MENPLSSLRATFMPQGRIFYGWWIVLASAQAQMLPSLLWMQSYGAYIVLMQEEFGWSKTLFAGAFALARMESGLLGPLQGWLVDRFGPRLILTIGMAIFGIGFVAFSQIDSLLGFYLSFALIALGSSLGGFATLMVSLVNWFSQHRSKAVAFSQAGYALGGFCIPLLILALQTWGWRPTALASGILVLLIGIPIVQIVRHRPEEIGETVDGIGPLAAGAAAAAGSINFTAAQALRTRAFWLISIGHAIALLTVAALLVHLIPHLTEGLNFSLASAGTVIAIITGFQLFGQFVGGYLGDRINKRAICTACMIGHAAGLTLVTFAESWPAVLCFAALHGTAWGARGPQMIAMRADYFGATSFGTILGFSSLIVMAGTMGGPLLAGRLADLHGSYELGFSVIAGASLVGALCFWFATPPPPPATAAPASTTT